MGGRKRRKEIKTLHGKKMNRVPERLIERERDGKGDSLKKELSEYAMQSSGLISRATEFPYQFQLADLAQIMSS